MDTVPKRPIQIKKYGLFPFFHAVPLSFLCIVSGKKRFVQIAEAENMWYTTPIMEKIAYELIRSDRRTMGLEVDTEGQVRVRAPRFTPRWRIDAFVEERRAWIEQARARQARRQAKLPHIREEDKPLYVKRAKAILPEKIDRYARIMGVQPTGLTVTSAKTRFGSCSAKNRLSFSWRLMAYPEAAIDYVVVHELAHIRYKDHGRGFYGFVASVLPDYKDRIRLLQGR